MPPPRFLAACLALALAAGLGSAAAPPGPSDFVVSGNGACLWLARPAGDGAFDLALRRLSLPWRIAARELPGNVQAIAAVNNQLHLLVTQPGAGPRITHLVLQPPAEESLRDPDIMEGVAPHDSRWSENSAVLAAFEMPESGRAASASLIVVVSGPVTEPASASGAASSTSAPAAATLPSGPAGPATPRRPRTASPERPTLRASASASAAGRSGLHLFRYADAKWTCLASYADISIGPRTRVAATAAEGQIFLYVSGLLWQPDKFLQFSAGRWSELPALPPPAEPLPERAASAPASPLPATADASPSAAGPATPHIVTMVMLRGRPVLVRTVPAPAPARWRLQLAIFTPESAASSPAATSFAPPEKAAGAFYVQEVATPGQTDPWAGVDFAANPLRAARLGEQIALLWRDGERLRMGGVDLTGLYLPQSDVAVFQSQAAPGDAEQVRDYFVLASLILSSLLAFSLRTAVPLRPFQLPAGLAVAGPLRRLAAAIIDLIPFQVAGGLVARFILHVPLMTWSELSRLAQEHRLPVELFYCGMGSISLYVLYCIVAEHRFGVTLGKHLLKIRVTSDQGQKAKLQQIALRNMLKIVELLWPSVPVILLVPLINRNRQRLGDMFARTAVVTGQPVPGAGEKQPPADGPDRGRE